VTNDGIFNDVVGRREYIGYLYINYPMNLYDSNYPGSDQPLLVLRESHYVLQSGKELRL
jgi:hypothetical protein